MVENPSVELKINIDKIKKNIDCLIQWREYDALAALLDKQPELLELSWDFKVLSNILDLYKLQREAVEVTILHHGASLDECNSFYIKYTYYLLAANEQRGDQESEQWQQLTQFIEVNNITAFEIITTCAYIKLSGMQEFIEALGCSFYEAGNWRLAISLLDLYLQIYEVGDEIALDLASIYLYEEDADSAREYLKKVRNHNEVYLELSKRIGIQ